MNIQNWSEQDHPRDKQGKFTEKSNHTAKSFEQRQQDDIDKGELVELGKFPTKFTSEYPKGFITDTTKKDGSYKHSMQRVTDKLKELDRFDLGNWLPDKELISERYLNDIYDDEEKLHQFIYDVFQDDDISDEVKESLFKRKNFDKEFDKERKGRIAQAENKPPLHKIIQNAIIKEVAKVVNNLGE